ncbi:MAG: GAF domain-containing protein [Cyclobacteriaceae bacterium]
MNFFRNRSLKQLSIMLAAAFMVVITLQMLWLQYRNTRVESVQNQIDFIRTIQLNNQRLSLQLEHAQQDASLSAAVISLVKQQDLHFQLVETGGRVPGSDVFLPRLQRLPKITFENLITLWSNHRKQILDFNSASTKNLSDIQAQSILVSDWLGKLSDDLYDEAVVAKKSTSTVILLIIVGDFLLLAAFVAWFNRSILTHLTRMEENTILHNHTNGFRNNEIGSLATQVNEVIEQLRDATDFVKGIGEGKLDMDYKAELDSNYAPGKNKLADELIAMQTKLKTVYVEDQRRKWTNEGLTKFVDILRNANDNVQTLGDKIISSLVQYTGSNQGGLYILNDDDENNRHLELISLFAFNIKKFEKQRIKLGEGILGQTFLEKETTYLTNMPDDFTRITSGLGDATPKSLLIVPLKVDKEVYGIVELASFREFEPHEINFVERLGETIASTLSSVKANQRNKRLLEQSQQQTEEMRAQEEEMRQNMEELTATQEGMNRLLQEAQDKETYLNNLMDATTDAIVAIDRDYRVVLRNNAPLFDGFTAQGIKYEKGYYVLGLFKQEEFEYHKGIYDKAFAGGTVKVTKEYFGRKYSISYNPLRSNTGEVIGVSIFAHDETELESLKEQISRLQKTEGDSGWKLAEEVEKTFRIQLEALKITQEALTHKNR